MALTQAGKPSVLILRALGLGDLLTAVPALRGIARMHSEYCRILLTTGWLRPLIPLIRCESAPCVDRVVSVGGLDIDPLRLPQRPELAINLHGSGPQSHALLESTRPLRTIAFRCDENPHAQGSVRWRDDEHDVARWCRLLTESSVPADPDELRLDPPLLKAPDWAQGAILIHPGAASRSRRWPVKRWTEVARRLLLEGREVAITGGPSETRLARRIGYRAGIHPSRVIAGRTSVLELASFVAAAGIVVCGDTGVAHLATALRVPSVLLFGPTPPDRWGPSIDPELHRVIWTGRRGDPHGDKIDPGLLEIDTDTVLAALSEQRQAPGRDRRKIPLSTVS